MGGGALHRESSFFEYQKASKKSQLKEVGEEDEFTHPTYRHNFNIAF